MLISKKGRLKDGPFSWQVKILWLFPRLLDLIRINGLAHEDFGLGLGHVVTAELDVLGLLSFDFEEGIDLALAGGLFDGDVLAVLDGHDRGLLGTDLDAGQLDAVDIGAFQAPVGVDGDVFQGEVFQRLFGQADDLHGPAGVFAGDVLEVEVAEDRRGLGGGHQGAETVEGAKRQGGPADAAHGDVLNVYVFDDTAAAPQWI